MQKKNKSISLFIALFGFVLFVSWVVLLTLVDSRPTNFFWGFSTVVIPIIEITFFCSLFCVLAGLASWKKLLLGSLVAPLPLAVIALFYLLQFVSISVSGDYVSSLALENASETRYVKNAAVTVAAAAFFALLAYWAIVRGVRQGKFAVYSLKLPSIVAVTSGIFFVALFDSSSESSRNPDLLRPELAPATGLMKTIRAFVSNTDDELGVNRYLARVESLEAPFPSMFNPLSEHPFAKASAYEGNLPFRKVSTDGEKLNLIVIFAEGFSARLISAYGGEYEDLTPNLNAFAERSMVVDNYFNHTAATYRGLQGQITSGWSVRTGGSTWSDWDKRDNTKGDSREKLVARSMVSMLEGYGYHTAFVCAHHSSNPLNNMLSALGFDEVYTLERFSELLKYEPLPLSTIAAASDESLFEGLKQYVANEYMAEKTEPFFVATYNIGTHAFMDSPERAPKFRGGDNFALNRFYEFDRAFGDFLEYFLNSEASANTVLVVTSDHASFPEPSYREAIKDSSYQPYFVDRIPLMIFAPHLELPERFDANYRTSIDLAPTLMHVLAVGEFENAFAGRSIFEERKHEGLGVASISDDFYKVAEEGVQKISLTSMPPEVSELVNTARFYRVLESRDKLLPSRSQDN